MPSPSTSRENGKKGGAPKGRKLPAATIERLRNSINTKLAIDTLHEMARRGGQHDGVRVSAATALLKKVLPDLTATDLTSGGEPITVERVAFKPTTEKTK